MDIRICTIEMKTNNNSSFLPSNCNLGETNVIFTNLNFTSHSVKQGKLSHLNYWELHDSQILSNNLDSWNHSHPSISIELGNPHRDYNSLQKQSLLWKMQKFSSERIYNLKWFRVTMKTETYGSLSTGALWRQVKPRKQPTVFFNSYNFQKNLLIQNLG